MFNSGLSVFIKELLLQQLRVEFYRMLSSRNAYVGFHIQQISKYQVMQLCLPSRNVKLRTLHLGKK